MQDKRYLDNNYKTHKMIKSGGNQNELSKIINRRLFGGKKGKKAQAEHLSQFQSEPKTENLNVRLTAKEKAILQDFSKTTGVSYSTMVRVALAALSINK